MTLNKQCSCKIHLTTKNTYSIGRNELGLWLNCKGCESTVLMVKKIELKPDYSLIKTILKDSFNITKQDLNNINKGLKNV